jgi:hypothetical protein
MRVFRADRLRAQPRDERAANGVLISDRQCSGAVPQRRAGRGRPLALAADDVVQESSGLEVACFAFFSARFSFSVLPAFFD